MKSILVRFDGHTIYQIYIKKESCIIKAKNFQIFEDIDIRKNTILSEKLTFQYLFLNNNDNKENISDKALNMILFSITKDQIKQKIAE